jgi:electron transfer flavoprotein alpha subunit
MSHDRTPKVLTGPVGEQVAEAVALLQQRGALVTAPPEAAPPDVSERSPRGSGRVIAVLTEPGRPQVGAELLGAAARLSEEVAGQVHAVAFEDGDSAELGALGADAVTTLTGIPTPEDVAAALVEWAEDVPLWALLGPSTAFGREVLGRVAAALGAGLVGDAIALEVVEDELVAAKPAFSGALVADISCTSAVRLVSVRPGVLPLPARRPCFPATSSREVRPRSRLRSLAHQRDDDIEVLARADAVIGVGSAVQPHDYGELSTLAALLGAEMAATRKVTDKGWAPRARQVGITGRSIAPRLYVAVGLSGKFNHMVGVRAAGTIVAINNDPEALVFAHCDIGLVGDWHDVVPALTEALRRERTS